MKHHITKMVNKAHKERMDESMKHEMAKGDPKADKKEKKDAK